MVALICFVLAVLASPFKSKSRLEAENAVLRHQLIVLQRKVRGRAHLTNNDRWFFVQMYRWFPSILKVVTIIEPETLVRWHRAGFRRYWRWKSRSRGGRPQIDVELRTLIRQMSTANPLWGAPRIHGELLKLGIEIGQTSVAKYMVKRREPPSQGWKTFLRNHADGIAAMDMFIVPTISFRLLYGLLIMGHGRRHILWFGSRELDRLELLIEQVKIVETERDALFAPAVKTGQLPAPQAMLADLKGIGAEFVAVLWSEGLCRSFTNRKQLGAYAGLAPTPWQSGSVAHEQGVSKAGNPRLRTTMIQLAWLWLRHQPQSALALWFKERVSHNGGRLKKTTIVALARKLLVALWKYVTAGIVIEGAVMKSTA